MSRIDDKLIYNLTWTTIHVMARSMDRDPERALGFICFMEGLRDLFPLANVRDTLNKYMTEHPLTPNGPQFQSARACFNWTYHLHEYASWARQKKCGRDVKLRLPFDEEKMWELYSPVNFPNNSWGGPFWTVFHYVAANLPALLTALQFTYWVAFVRGFNKALPCGMCRNHMNEFLQQNQLVAPYKRSHYMQGMNNWAFTTMFHNEVNRRLGKHVMSDEELEVWRKQLLVDVGSSSGLLICSV